MSKKSTVKKLSRKWYRCKYFQIKNIKSIREELLHYDGLVELSWYHKHKNAIKGFIITWVRTNKRPKPDKTEVIA